MGVCRLSCTWQGLERLNVLGRHIAKVAEVGPCLQHLDHVSLPYSMQILYYTLLYNYNIILSHAILYYNVLFYTNASPHGKVPDASSYESPT